MAQKDGKGSEQLLIFWLMEMTRWSASAVWREASWRIVSNFSPRDVLSDDARLVKTFLIPRKQGLNCFLELLFLSKLITGQHSRESCLFPKLNYAPCHIYANSRHKNKQMHFYQVKVALPKLRRYRLDKFTGRSSMLSQAN